MEIRLISVRNGRAGMRLAKSIRNEEGLVLLAEGMELTDSLLKRLEKSGIDYIYVHDPRTDDIEIPELLSEETRREALRQVQFHFRTMMDRSARVRGVHNLDKDFRRVLNMMIDDLYHNKDAMMMLTEMSISDHYLYQHSVNVCTYALVLGIAQDYSREELMMLGLGALLHDIGKTQVPLEILQKPGKLTDAEMDIVKAHTNVGFQMLKDEPNIPLISAHCALQHHERLDGSGYPRGLKGGEIHEYAQWIGIIDVYDALTTNRAYRPAMLPHRALEILFTGADSLYDIEKLKAFRDRIALYPLGITVTLNTGETGVVVDVNSTYPQRPIVRIIRDAEGQEVHPPYEVDLSKKLSLMITGVDQLETGDSEWAEEWLEDIR